VAANRKVLLLPGDGIGPEVVGQARRVLDFIAKKRRFAVDVTEGLVGGAAIDAQGVPLSAATLAQAKAVDAVLLGAVGGPKWDALPFEKKPELCLPALAEASTLRPDVVSGLDIMIVRELTGGVYFGQPRGIETLPDGSRRGVNTQVYTTQEIRRVAAVAFELARKRRGQVCSVEKSNVMESGILWREEVTKLHAEAYKDVALSHMYADNCAMQLVRDPKQFDVVLTDNLFGDILSDEAAMLTGSLGMLPSASLGAADAEGRRAALYEPVHGSAPDIAGQGIANPLAAILSLAMMLRYSFGRAEDADAIEAAVARVLDRGLRTADIMQPGKTRVSTAAMAEAILRELDGRTG
jgi:3-isopropylmalate dehydrogenase